MEVRNERTGDFNRPPEPISVYLDPHNSNEGQALACLVNTTLTLDDPDYDLVRYEYVWTVNGGEVRRVTTAAHSDVLAHDQMNADDFVVCAVTPSDGVASGSGDSASATIDELIVPALSDWGLAVMCLLMATCGVVVIKLRHLAGVDRRSVS